MLPVEVWLFVDDVYDVMQANQRHTLFADKTTSRVPSRMILCLLISITFARDKIVDIASVDEQACFCE